MADLLDEASLAVLRALEAGHRRLSAARRQYAGHALSADAVSTNARNAFRPF